MKRSHYTNYDQLPLFLNAELVSKTLGIAPSSAYELMHEKNFPLCASAAAWWCRKTNLSSGWCSIRKAVAASEQSQAAYGLGAGEELFPRA